MRIAVFDNWGGKFTGVLMDHWRSLGHEVMHELGFNPNLVETCDRVLFESADTNAHLATQQRPHKKGKVFVRIVDIDAHVNGPAGIKAGYMDGVIYIADHIKEMCDKRFANLKGIPSKVINMGIDMDKFTLNNHESGKKIAFISTRLSPEKGFDRALMIFKELRKQSNQWELHVVGRMYENSVWEMHINHLKDGVSGIHMLGNLPDGPDAINQFLSDKDYLLSCSHKEAFSFVVGEAMAKGITPVIYDFHGAKDIWPAYHLFQNEHEAVKLLTRGGQYTNRKYIEDNYPLQKHLDEMTEFMEIL